jgi:predicted ferric reductase
VIERLIRPRRRAPSFERAHGVDAGAARHHRALVMRGWALGLLAMLAVLVPFAVLLTGERPAARGFLWDFSMGLGFGAMALVALQFLLTGRIQWLTHPFGADLVYRFHRYLSHGAVALMLGHLAILYLWHQPALGVLNPLEARWELTSGRLALLCFVGLLVTSELRKWLGLRYEFWRALHLGLAIVGFAAAVAHILGVGNHTGAADKRALWLGATAGWIGLLAWTRIVRPLNQLRNPWRVVDNRARHGGVHTLELAPQGAALRNWRPGQFAWLSIGRSPFSLREHPFTISTAPERGPNLAFSIKPLGDDTARLVQTPPGTRAYVDGPYGAFSIDREPDAPGFVMIAGGVGITPIVANLHALETRGDGRPVILLYANSRWEDAAFRDELAAMGRTLRLTLVHVIEDPPQDWDGARGRIDRAMLERHLPTETRDWPHFLCGPAPMTEAATAALRAMGVPARRIGFEIFEMV